MLEVHAAQGLDSYFSPWEACLGGGLSTGSLQCFCLGFCLSLAAVAGGHHFLSAGHGLLKKTQPTYQTAILLNDVTLEPSSCWLGFHSHQL